MKKTAIAPSNIAFIKYWGKKDDILRIPSNGSISMNLSGLTTTTTVEFSEKYKKDDIIIDDKIDKMVDSRVIDHLNRIRKISGLKLKAKVVSQNNFPVSTGLSSSASGFAALTVAASAAAGLKLSEGELSILARLGSGSSCRSIPDGFVEWFEGSSSETSIAKSIFPPDYWDICDVVIILSKSVKYLPTTQGQKFASTSPFFKTRLSKIAGKIEMIKQFIKEKNFGKFGELVESEALELHAIMLTSKPSLIYFYPQTLEAILLVKKLRQEGLSCYFTLNTGQNLHLIIREKEKEELIKQLKRNLGVNKIIVNYPSTGTRLKAEHLF